jgi:signal transduction histidine kinase
LRAIGEVGLRWSQGLDAPATKDVLAITLGMEQMVTRLLALARAENAATPLTIEPLRVAELVETIWAPLSPPSTLKQLSTVFNISPIAIIHSDRALLSGIITNLLVNAVEYTPPGGSLRVEYFEHAGHFVLSLSNTIHDLLLEDVPKLFRRFWRKDQARSDENRTGLGLALAKAFCTLLGLELTADLEGEHQLTLRVSGPILAQAENRPTTSRQAPPTAS